MKNSFSFDRFWLYAKAELMSSRRLMLLLLGCMEGLFMLIYYLNHLSMRDLSDLSDRYYPTLNALGFVWFSIVIVCLINISMSFRNYFNKGYANNTIMQPAAQSEKFTYTLIMNSFMVPLMLAILCVVTDLIWTSFYGVNLLITPWGANSWVMLCVISLGVFFLSLFFLGSVLLRRYQFVMTFIALSILVVVLVICIFWINRIDPNFFRDLWFNPLLKLRAKYGYYIYYQIVFSISSLLCLIASSFVWFIAWKRFRKLQITK